MATQELDLTHPERPSTYSKATERKARAELKRGSLRLLEGTTSAEVQSATSPTAWITTATVEGHTSLGVTCTCPNGRKAGVRARCWHAAALEQHLETIGTTHPTQNGASA